MAWEWVAPVATAVSGIVGVGFTWYAGHQGRKHAEKVAERTAETQIALAREVRRADAYRELSALLIDFVLLYPEDPSKPPRSRLPTRDEMHDRMLGAEISIGLYASKEVQKLYREWTDCATSLFQQDRKFQLSAENRADLVPLSDSEYMDAFKAMARGNVALRRQMHDELTS